MESNNKDNNQPSLGESCLCINEKIFFANLSKCTSLHSLPSQMKLTSIYRQNIVEKLNSRPGLNWSNGRFWTWLNSRGWFSSFVMMRFPTISKLPLKNLRPAAGLLQILSLQKERFKVRRFWNSCLYSLPMFSAFVPCRR